MILEINKKEIKFGFGLYFLGKAREFKDTDLNGLLTSIAKNPISDIVDLMYFSAKCEAEIDEIELNLSKREFLTFLEETNDFDNEDGVLSKWSNKFINTIKGHFFKDVDDVEDIEVDSEEVEKKN